MQVHRNQLLQKIKGYVFLYSIIIIASILGITHAVSPHADDSHTIPSQEPQNNAVTIVGGQKFYSAPPQQDFPVTIVLGNDTNTRENTKTQNQPIPVSGKKTSPTQQSLSSSVNCLTIHMCEKVYIEPGFPATKLRDYTRIIYETIQALNENIQKPQKLSEVLFSISVSPHAGERRGRGGGQTIQLYTKDMHSNEEFRNVLVHELGHSIDLGVIIGTGNNIDSRFLIGNKPQFNTNDPSLDFYTISRINSTTRKSDAGYKDFVSGYGMTSPYEDFAESFTLFLLHNNTFKAMATQSSMLAQKYAYFWGLTQGFSFAKDIKNTKKVLQSPGRRPWDVSKISNN